MKFSILSTSLFLTSNYAHAFAPTPTKTLIATSSTTSLNLFGGKKESSDSGNKNPMGGMMDQLAMFKKAQEIAKKKNDLDKEIAEMDIIGSAADGKIKVTVQYVPAQLPVNPSPGYDAVKVDIDEEYLNGVSCEDLSAALVDAIRSGEAKANEVVAEKYKSLEAEMTEILGGLQK
jgi:DNA-binding protein YbaB